MIRLRNFPVYVIGASLLGLLLFALLRSGGGRLRAGVDEADLRPADNESTVVDTALVRLLPMPVVAYLAACGTERRLTDEPVAYQAELRECIRKMTGALEAVVNSGTMSTSQPARQLQTHRHTTERILSRQGESLQTPPTREMLASAGLVLAVLWEARYRDVPGLAREVAQLRRTVRRLDGADPLFYQRDQVEEVLDRAGTAILLMTREEVRQGTRQGAHPG